MCLKLSAEGESVVGTILQASIKALEESNKHIAESCVSFSAGSDKEPLGNDADFVAAINFGNLDKAGPDNCYGWANTRGDADHDLVNAEWSEYTGSEWVDAPAAASVACSIGACRLC